MLIKKNFQHNDCCEKTCRNYWWILQQERKLENIRFKVVWQYAYIHMSEELYFHYMLNRVT